MKRVPGSKVTQETIEEMLRGERGDENPMGELVLLAVRRLAEEALEASVRDLLGREYYERQPGGASGYRNGKRTGRLKTSEGEVEYSSPQVRGIDSSHLTELRTHLRGRTKRLEELAVEMYARGCSTRDIEAIFKTEEGRSLLSRTAVSEVTEILWEEYKSFAGRDLSEIEPLYLFLDGLYERLGPGPRREAILVAWCIDAEGRKRLIHLAPGTKESHECGVEFLHDLQRRGLRDPVLTVTDGAAGIIKAVNDVYPDSLRQRCLAHKMRNLMNKVPEAARSEFKEAARAAYQAPSVALAQMLRQDLVARFDRDHPSAVICFEEDFDACVAQLRCPTTHRKRIRTTNLLERLFREERRRSRAAGIVFGERPVLKLMYSALIRASDTWRGIQVNELETAQLQRLRETIREERRKGTAAVVQEDKQPSAPVSFSSKKRT